MYTPEKFLQADPAQLLAFMQEHNFGLLLTSHDDRGVSGSHLPFLIEERTGGYALFTHMAQANPQWQDLQSQKRVMVVFTGPHAYVTPTWYTRDGYVPTWNYTAVHAYGAAEIIADRDRCSALLERTVRAHEHGAGAWSTARLDAERFQSLQRRIIHIEIEVDRVEGKFKLSQDKPENERQAVMAGLQAEGTPSATAVAELMRRHRASD